MIQAVALLLYGIYNHCVLGGKENRIVLSIFAAWVILNFVVEAVVKTRYVSLLRSERPGKNIILSDIKSARSFLKKNSLCFLVQRKM